MAPLYIPCKLAISSGHHFKGPIEKLLGIGLARVQDPWNSLSIPQKGKTMYRLLLLLLSLMLSAATIAYAVSFTFSTIDAPFAGVLLTSPSGINDSGQIAGFYLTAGLASHGFVLSDGNFSVFHFPMGPATNFNAINNQGQIVGYGGGVSFLFESGEFSIISVPGSNFTSASGINNTGQIVGATIVGNEAIGFLLNEGSFSFIRVPGAPSTSAHSINDAGQIVGRAGIHGFLLANGVFSAVDFPGALNTSPTGINNAGTIVGWYQTPDTLQHGFILDQQGFSTIEFPGSTFTLVTGINSRGQIVGGYRDSSGTDHGFVATLTAPAFAGTPGRPNCRGESVSALAQEFGGLDAAASALAFRNVQALHEAIRGFCGR